MTLEARYIWVAEDLLSHLLLSVSILLGTGQGL